MTLTLPDVAGLIVPEIADCFVLFLASDEGSLPTAESWHLDGECAPALREGIRALFGAHGPMADAVLAKLRSAEGKSSDSWDQALLSVYASIRVSGTAVPVTAGPRECGLLVLAYLPGSAHAAGDVEFTRSIAYRIGMTLEQENLLKQARRAVAARDRALSIVSHDLRNPLTTIQICARALLDPEPAPPSGVHHIGELIDKSASWMEQIVADLIDRTSLDAGTLTLQRRATPVPELFDAVSSMFADVAKQHSIELSLRLANGLPLVDVDPHRLLQVLSNLINNALKFTAAGGHVELAAQQVEDDSGKALLAGQLRSPVRFMVKDTGSGISPDDLSHVFDWYWQSPKGNTKGTGLGLAIAKGLIEAHLSELYVESALGVGSSFWFTMPAASSAGAGSQIGGALA